MTRLIGCFSLKTSDGVRPNRLTAGMLQEFVIVFSEKTEERGKGLLYRAHSRAFAFLHPLCVQAVAMLCVEKHFLSIASYKREGNETQKRKGSPGRKSKTVPALRDHPTLFFMYHKSSARPYLTSTIRGKTDSSYKYQDGGTQSNQERTCQTVYTQPDEPIIDFVWYCNVCDIPA